MNWRDLLYFSNGERRALTLLLSLICISWILLLLTEKRPDYLPDRQDKTTESIQITPNRVTKQPAQVRRPTPTSGSKNNSFRKKTEFHPKETKNTSERRSFPKTEKYPAGTLVELNTADTTSLKKVPGIGSTFARRIVKYRKLLGGFYSVDQLREVYGMEEERYHKLKPWFSVDISLISPLTVNKMSLKELVKHPYITYPQARVIEQLRRQKGKLTGWENFRLLEEFTDTDKERLLPYLSFE